MSEGHPIPMTYEGDGEFRAPGLWAKRCDHRFTVHEQYSLIEVEARSGASHRQQFAAIRDHWRNWPEHAPLQFNTRDDLRKHALIMSGWRTETKSAFSSNRDAVQAMAIASQSTREYTLFSVEGNILLMWRARSQRMSGPECMANKEFQKSKTDCLEWIEAYLDELRKSRAAA